MEKVLEKIAKKILPFTQERLNRIWRECDEHNVELSPDECAGMLLTYWDEGE